MSDYIDLLMTASCYKSAPSAVRMIESTPKLQANCFIVITSPLQDDLSYIRFHCHRDNLRLFLSKVDNMYVCRNWGFLWAYIHGIIPRYYCSMDDDIEFIEQSDTVLPALEHLPFSVMSFSNRAQSYQGWKPADTSPGYKVVPWLNGDSMFTSYSDNLKYGLLDCLPGGEPSPFLVESEYQQRLAALSSRPLIAAHEHVFYVHHFRDEPEKVKLRNINVMTRINSGLDFFRRKYPGLIPGRVDINKVNVHGMMREHIIKNPAQAQHHLLYDGLWTDFNAIYERYKDNFVQIF